MRVLFVVKSLLIGGLERQLIEIIKQLKQKNHSIHLVVLNRPGPFSREAEKLLDSKIMYIGFQRMIFPVALLKLFFKLIRTKPDVIHVQDRLSAFYMLLISKLCRKPLINAGIQNAGYSMGIKNYIEKPLLHLSDVVLANSQAGLNYYGIKGGRVIYNLLDRARFKQSSGSLKNIVMNANFTDKKDQLTFMQAAKRLIDEDRIERVSFIGDGIYKQKYQRLAEEWGIAGKTRFYGQVSNVEEILCDYGIGVLCSTKRYKEGIANSILEYMGAGLIAIGTNIGAVPEIIEDGVNGFLFEVEDPVSLYEKIRFVLDNPQNLDDLRTKAYETLEEKFSAEENCRILIETYKSAMEKRAQRIRRML